MQLRYFEMAVVDGCFIFQLNVQLFLFEKPFVACKMFIFIVPAAA